MHAQTDYTPKHTGNSTITTQGTPNVILQASAIQKRRN